MSDMNEFMNEFWETQKRAEERSKRIEENARLNIGYIPPSYSPLMRQHIISIAYTCAEQDEKRREDEERSRKEFQKKMYGWE